MAKNIHVVIVDEFKPFFVNLSRVMNEIISVGDNVRMGTLNFQQLISTRSPIHLLDGQDDGEYFLIVEMTQFSIYDFLSIQAAVLESPLQKTYPNIQYHIIEPVLTAYNWGFDIKNFTKANPLKWREFTLEALPECE